MNPFSLLFEWLEALRLRSEHAHSEVSDDSDEDIQIADDTDDVAPARFNEISAWCGNASLASPDRDVSFAERIGLSGLEIIVNDMPTKMGRGGGWGPRPFAMRSTDKIERLVARCLDSGVAPTFMIWTMPHLEYIKEMGKQLVLLCKRTSVKRVSLDAEEPQTQARKANGRRLSAKEYRQSALWLKEFVVDPLHEIGVEVWVTGIRYTPKKALGPLVKYDGEVIEKKDLASVRQQMRAIGPMYAICDGAIPQCYSTNTSKADPSTVVEKGVRTYRKKFGPKVPLMIAGAAYRQDGIKGHKTRSAMMAFFEDCEEYFEANPSQPRIVLLWGLNSIRRNNKVASVVKDLTKELLTPEIEPAERV